MNDTINILSGLSVAQLAAILAWVFYWWRAHAEVLQRLARLEAKVDIMREGKVV